MSRLKLGGLYRIKLQDGEVVKAQYMGRQKGFECQVCGKGHNTRTFNIWYANVSSTGKYYEDYQTYAFGDSHMPEILEELFGESCINDY